MAYEFVARNGIIALDNSIITGSLNVTGGITGSLEGTASYSNNALSASYAQTSSYADSFTVAGTLTAQKLVVQTISSSIVYSSGSNIFGNDSSNTQQFTGSVLISGSLFVGLPNTIPTDETTNEVLVLNTTTGRVGRRFAAATSGTSGTSGINGTSGTSGTSGNSGSSGSSGTSGVNGTSGTSGSSGSSGVNGTSGTSGANGSSGTSGVNGSSGTSGVNGTSGSSGSSGSSGVNGTSGSSGVNGTSGTSGSSGTRGTSGTSGVNGTSGTSGSSGSSGTTPVNQVTGTGTTNYLSKFTGTSTIGNSQIYDNGTNVGIGTASPSEKLDVIGGALAAGNGTIRTGITYSSLGLIGTFTNHDLGVITNGSERMRITSAGNVGIGTTSPTTTLHVLANSAADEGNAAAIIRQGGGNNNNGLLVDVTNSVNAYIADFRQGNSSLMRFTGAGNLLINTTSDTGLYKLDVNGTGRFGGALQISNNANNGVAGTNFQAFAVSSNSFFRLGNNTSNSLNIQLTRSDSATMFSVDGHTGASTFFGAATFSSSVAMTYLAVGSSGGEIGNFNSTNANGGYLTWQTSGTTIADIGTSQQIFGSGGNDTFGINARGARNLVFGANNTERMRITSGGNVGIGTTSPAFKLQLRSDSAASSSLDNTAFGLYNNSDGGSAIYFSNAVGAQSKVSFGVESTGAGTDDTYLGFSTGANTTISERMRITSAGNVGIACTPNFGRVEIQGSTTDKRLYIATNAFYSNSIDVLGINSSGGEIALGIGGSQIQYYTGATERMRITSGGNVLIGTDADTGLYKLDVNGTALFRGKTNISKSISDYAFTVVNTDSIGYGIYIQAGSTNNAIDVFNSSGTTQLFKLTGTGAATFSSSVTATNYNSTIANKATLATASGAINVPYTTSNVNEFQTIGFSYPSSVDNVTRWGMALTATNFSSGLADLIFFTAATERLRINNSGAATFSSSVTATGFFVSSDITLKTLTQDKFNASKIDAISYKWKTDLQGKTHVGYSAQQVQQYMPDAVNTDSNGQLSVDYIQVLVQKIAHLEQKLKEHGLD